MNVLEIHMLQTVPSSNINRDEDGECKTAIFGGVVRHRVSSQAWKRPIRQMIQKECLANGDIVGTRSKEFYKAIIAQLTSEGLAEKSIETELKTLKIGVDENTLMYLSSDEVELITNGIRSKIVENKPLKELKDIVTEGKTRIALDISLFGRMFASNPALNVNQALNSNQATSTHSIETETDYFTSIDDLQVDPGAGHLGNSAFASSTLYRYFSIDLDQLKKNLGSSPVAAVPMILKSIATAFPSGKQTSMNAITRPSYVRVMLRNGQPQQFCNAFENPVMSDDNGFMTPSIARIEAEIEKDLALWGSDEIKYNEVLSIEKNFNTICQEVCEKIAELDKV
jgi:CRISPR system Cascade subunit CasC